MMIMPIAVVNEVLSAISKIAVYALGHTPSSIDEVNDVMDYSRCTFYKLMSAMEEQQADEWEFVGDDEEEERDCKDGTCPCCYDDEDNLWEDEEKYNRPNPCDSDCVCGECFCGDCREEEEDTCEGCSCCNGDSECVNRHEDVEITNPNYAEVDKEIAKIFEAFGLEAPEEEDMEGIHNLMDTMSSILSEIVNKCSES